jgi:hypothetical protein
MRIARWDQVLTTEDSNVCVLELSNWCLSKIHNRELRESLTTLVGGSDYLGLCNFSVDYCAVSASDAYFVRQLLAFYSKRADLELGIDREAVAFSAFETSERVCAETNTLLRMWASGRFNFLPDVESVLFRAQRKIAHVLGDVPSLSALKPRFGPGATTQLQKRTSSARKKLSQEFACSEDLLPLVKEVLEEMQGWIPFTEDSESAVVTVEIFRGLLRFVPKNARTDRSIVVEPMLNSMFQIGIGDYIARRLRVFGIDISDQTRNQTLAQEGSISGALATLDLSSASDTIARELVAHLLPVDWFFFLDRFRTSEIQYKGETMRLQKFSSMGNGFTFPLETLIFWALASSATEESRRDKVSVYGDDIIVDVRDAPLVCRVLQTAGFSVNKEKSYTTGPFRESCGKDYYSGILIRPVYLKDKLSGESAFTLHNFFVRRGFPEAANIIVSWLDPSMVLWGPDGYGDGHLLGDFTSVPSKHGYHSSPNGRGWSGYTFETYSWKGRKDFSPYPRDYVYPSYSIYVGSSSLDQPDRHFGLIARNARLAKRILGESQVFKSLRPVLEINAGCKSYYRRGSLGSSLPGVNGYKRIKIYTLDPS